MSPTPIHIDVSAVIAAAWADHVSFEKIKKDTGLSESEVIVLMRKNLKPRSFALWRQRVSGRKSKHEKKQKLMMRAQD